MMNNNYIYPNRSNISYRNLYSDNFINLNKGRNASFYLSFKNSKEWQDTIIKGTIQDSNNDTTIIKDSTTGKIIMIYNMYIDYIIFD